MKVKHSRSGLGRAVTKATVKVWGGMNLGSVLRVNFLGAGEGCIELRPGREARTIQSYGPDSGPHEFPGTERSRKYLVYPVSLWCYRPSFEIPSSDSGLLLIKRRGTALTIKSFHPGV